MIVEIDGLQRQRHVRRHIVAGLQIKRELRRLHEGPEIVEMPAIRIGRKIAPIAPPDN